MDETADRGTQLRLEALSDPSKRAKQHRKGKLTARERIEVFVDQGTFEEFDMFATSMHTGARAGVAGDGVVTGIGKVRGRDVAIFSQDFTVHGGSLSWAHAQKICKVMDAALDLGIPIVGMNDSGGARIQEGVLSLAGYAEIFERNILASGVIPQISLILGPCAGGAVYSPAMTDFIFMTEHSSFMFVTGPEVLKTATHEEVTPSELGGSQMHAKQSGVANLVAANDVDLLLETRRLLGFLPQSNRQRVPRGDTEDSMTRTHPEVLRIVPRGASQPYDMRDVIKPVLDHGDFFELSQLYAPNIVTGFGRLGGYPIGVVANQPNVLAGCLDIKASRKAARFVRFCDCFSLPIVTFVDVPGFLPGLQQERDGIIVHGAKLLFAYGEATVPKLTVITRKAYGGAYDVMSSKHLRGDANFAWPQAEIAVMGARGAVKVLNRDIGEDEEQLLALEQEYQRAHFHPYTAAGYGFIDAVIAPEASRLHLARALERLQSKQVRNPPKKHDNLPL